MRDWIAGVMLVLGVLLVLAGATVVVLKALGAQPAPGGEPTAELPRVSPSARVLGAVRRMPAADRLIGWGLILLVLASIAAGAMSFGLSATAGTR
jgi:hypothetical protein